MCNANCVIFGVNNLEKVEVQGKKVIEVGAYNLNGSLRSIVEKNKPLSYLGVDIESGPGVDEVCRAEDLEERYGKDSFDLVLSTELLEHVKDWRKVISNLKRICKPGGIIMITTRSKGFGYHSYPYDYWRYEIDDMKKIFSDFKIISLQKDPQDPGVFVKVRKEDNFQEKDLSDIRLYNIVRDRRLDKVSEKDVLSLRFFFLFFKNKIKALLKTIKNR